MQANQAEPTNPIAATSQEENIAQSDVDFLQPSSKSRSLILVVCLLLVGLSAALVYLFIQNQSLKAQLGLPTNTIGSPKTCTYEGQIYQTGEGFTASDGCNSCSCTETGEIACTAMACIDSDMSVNNVEWNIYNDPQGRFSFQYPSDVFLVRDNPGDIEISTSDSNEETAMAIAINTHQPPDFLTIAGEPPPGVFEQLEINNLFTKYPTIEKLYVGDPPLSRYALLYPSDEFEIGNLFILVIIHKQDEMPQSLGGSGGRHAKLAGQILSTFEFIE